jgi:hypothetical protein
VRRVAIPADAHRGGLLAQGAILKVTANGSTTSPVVRGAWVAERLLGMEIPPPPSGVPAIEPDIRGTTTIREQLAQHRAAAACASCHRFMDPLGFALENFDPAGQWRISYPTDSSHPQRAARPVDVADVLADGTSVADFEEFRAALASRPEWLAHGIAGHMLVYGTGARLSFADREAVAAIARQTVSQGRGMRSILHAVVSHPLFLSK